MNLVRPRKALGVYSDWKALKKMVGNFYLGTIRIHGHFSQGDAASEAEVFARL